MIYTNQLPKIKVEFSDTITINEIKTVKAWAKENAETLKDYAADIINRMSALKNIVFYEVFKVTATYFNNYEKPVLHFIVEGSTEAPETYAFYEYFVDESSFTSYTYRRS